MKKLFVIDPDKNFQTLIKSLCDETKVNVQYFPEGKPAEKKAEEEMPDLIILNLELMDVNGFIVCNSLRKNSELKKIPLLITSSEKSERDFEQHRKLKFRADGYYRKPISKEDLKTVLLENLCKNCLKQVEQAGFNDEFTEENIDKLLESTFMDIGSEKPKHKTEPEMPPVKEDDSFSGDEKLHSDTQVSATLLVSADEGDFAFVGSDGQDEAIVPQESELENDIQIEIEEPEEPEVVNDEEEMMPELNFDEKPQNSTEAALINISGNLSKLKEENQDLSVQVISLEKQNEFLRNENKNLLINIKSLQADIAEKVEDETRIKEELQGKLKDVEQLLEQKLSQNSEYENTLNTLEESLEKEKAVKEQVQRHLDERNRELDDISRARNELSEELEKLATSLDELRREMESKDNLHSEELRKLEEQRINETERLFEESQEKVTLLETKLRELGDEKKKLQMELIEDSENNKRQLDELTQAKKEAEAKTSSYEEMIQNLEHEAASRSEEFEQFKKDKEEKENMLLSTIENLKNNLREAEEIEKKLKKKVNSLMSLFTNAKDLLGENNEE